MREIKFRAWHEQRKDFIYVATIDFVNKECYGLAFDIQESDEMLTCGLDKLEEFTGLTDKSGKDVYEGDICLYPSGVKREIVFMHGSFGYYTNSDDFVSMSHYGIKNIEVIGNIHENKELLK